MIQNFSPDGPRSVFWHPNAPWIYSICRESIGRYDDVTGETILVRPPQEITSMYSGEYDGPQQALLVGTSAGLYHVSEDLANWQRIETNLPSEGWRVYLSGEGGCIAGNWYSLFEAGEGLGVIGEGVRTSNRNPALSIYPNPTSGFLELHSPYSGMFEIFDLQGRLVSRNGVGASTNYIDLSADALATGSYYYRLKPFYGLAPSNSTGVFQLIR
jgi:hypothetical protein